MGFSLTTSTSQASQARLGVLLIFQETTCPIPYIEEIERIFDENGRHDLPSERLWKIDKYTIRATSLIRPRRNTAAKGELDIAGNLDVRVKTSLNVGEHVVQEQLLIVMVSDLQKITWDSIPNLGYNF